VIVFEVKVIRRILPFYSMGVDSADTVKCPTSMGKICMDSPHLLTITQHGVVPLHGCSNRGGKCQNLGSLIKQMLLGSSLVAVFSTYLFIYFSYFLVSH
jgi:hypothetical protein